MASSTTPVIIELVDFTNTTRSHHHLNISKNTLNDDHQNDQQDKNLDPAQQQPSGSVKHLINLLKSQIRKNKFKNFSLNFEYLGSLENLVTNHNYDVVISEHFNKIIVTQSSSLYVYDRLLSSNYTNTFDGKLANSSVQFRVDFTNELRCMRLIVEKDGQEYIYVSNNLNMVMKIKVSDLLNNRKDNQCEWKSEQFDNLWGIDVVKDKVYAMDYTKGIIVLNCKDGTRQVEHNFPQISSGYELKFLSETELLISHGTCLELFIKKVNVKKNVEKWKSQAKTKFPIVTAYSIFYEEGSQLIYLSDSSGHKIHILNRHDLSLVKSFGEFTMNFGLKVDRLSGLLFVCDTCKFVVEVYK